MPRLSLSVDEGGGSEPPVSHSRPGGDRRRRHEAPAPRPRCLGGPFSDRCWRPQNPFVQGESECTSSRFKVGSTCLTAPLQYQASRTSFGFLQRSEEHTSELQSLMRN